MDELSLLQKDVDLLGLRHSMEKNDLEFETLISISNTLEVIRSDIASEEISLESANMVVGGTFPTLSNVISLESKQISLEGVVETIKKIWAAIKKNLRIAWDMLTAFLSKLFGGLRRIKKKIDNLSNKFQNNLEYKQTIKSKQLASTLSIDGYYSKHKLSRGLDSVESIVGSVGKTPQQLEKQYDFIKEVVSERENSSEIIEFIAKAHLDRLKNRSESTVDSRINENVLPGNFYIVKSLDERVASNVEVIGSVWDEFDKGALGMYRIVQANSYSDVNLQDYNGNGEFIEVLSGEFCNRWTSTLREICSKIESLDDDIREIKNKRDEAIRATERLMSANDNGSISKELSKSEISNVNSILSKVGVKSLTSTYKFFYRYIRNSVKFLDGLEEA